MRHPFHVALRSRRRTRPHVLNLLRLAEITNQPEFHEAAEHTLNALSARISGQPVAVPQMLVALEYLHAKRRQVVLAGERQDELMQDFLNAMHARFHPHTVTLVVDGGPDRDTLRQLVPAIAEMKPLDGRPTAYVCENFACQLPTHDVSKFEELLQ